MIVFLKEFWQLTLSFCRWLFSDQSTGVLAIFAVWWAVFAYKTEIKNRRKDTSITLLMEIRYAEAQIVKIVSSGSEVSVSGIISNNSWKQLGYRINSFLDADDINLLNDFYSKCEQLEIMIKYYNEHQYVMIKEKAIQGIQKLLSLVEKHGNINKSEYINERNSILEPFFGETYGMILTGLVIGIKDIAKTITLITNTPTGEKIKNIANEGSLKDRI